MQIIESGVASASKQWQPLKIAWRESDGSLATADIVMTD